MEDRGVQYTVVATFESAHSAALWQVEMLNRGITAHVWPNDDPGSDPFVAWFVIVPDDQVERVDAARQAMAGPGMGVPSMSRVVVQRGTNGTAV
jgi:hypothetical protein